MDVSSEFVKEAFQNQFGKTKLQQPIEVKSFLDYLDEFTEEQGEKNTWTIATFEKFSAVKNHIIAFNEEPTFELFDEKGLTGYVTYLRKTKLMQDSTIGKQLGFIKWFLLFLTHYETHTTINICYRDMCV